MIKAVVDVGTNSIRLLIAEVEDGIINVIRTALMTTRIGEGMGQSRRLSQEAIERTVNGMTQYKEILDSYEVGRLLVVATSAVRDADNRDDFLQMLKSQVGWEVSVLEGEEEAYYSYLGATKGLAGEHTNTVVIDIGGGSTEFVWPEGEGIKCASLRIGAVRMTEKKAAIEDIQKILDELPKDSIISPNVNVVGVGGTFTTLAAIDLQLSEYDPERIHGYLLQKNSMYRILKTLEELSHCERKNVLGLQPERADIIVAGIRIAVSVAELMGVSEITVSETDIMYGLLYNL